MPRGSCSEVISQPPRPGLADVELSADRADRRNPIRRQMIGEYLGRLLLRVAPEGVERETEAPFAARPHRKGVRPELAKLGLEVTTRVGTRHRASSAI